MLLYLRKNKSGVMSNKIMAILAGIIAGNVGVMALEWLSMTLFPIPETINVRTPEGLKEYMEQAPVGSLLLVVVAWVAGAFLSALVCTILAKSDQLRLGLILGALMLVFTLINLIGFPHPWWMWVMAITGIMPAAYLGVKTGMKKTIVP